MYYRQCIEFIMLFGRKYFFLLKAFNEIFDLSICFPHKQAEKVEYFQLISSKISIRTKK